MKVFFDTEFTGLHKNTTLISIGCVDENNRTFYAEFTDYDKSQCNEWIEKNVISNLLGASNELTNIVGTKEEIAVALKDWLKEYDDVELVSDVCHYDMVLFIDIFGDAFDIPTHVNPACHDINQDIARVLGISEYQAFDKSRESICNDTVDGAKHNSLYDAKVIKCIYYKINVI